MKRFILILLIFFSCSVSVYAADNNHFNENLYDFAQEYNLDFEQIKENPFGVLWDIIKNSAKEFQSLQLKTFTKIATILILTSLLGFFVSSDGNNISIIVNTVSVFVILTNTFKLFLQLTEDAGAVFFEVKNFIVSFLPVFAGISFASGEMITSTVYTGFFLICVVTVANFCINYIIPSLNIFLAIGITDCTTSVIKLKPVCDFYSKIIKMLMTAAVSIICFVLSLQTTITQSQDTMAVKTGKMIVSSAVPIIGSTLQGAVTSVYASMGVLKGFCGIAGIAVILNIFLPLMINLAVHWMAYFMLNIIAQVLENDMAADMLLVQKEVVEILLSVSVLFMVLLLFSISIMIKIFEGV